jgi:hypothetical protein
MPDPIVAFSVVKFLWDESRSVRSTLMRKLPFAKDAAKRNLVDQELVRLLEDTGKLAKGLSPEQSDLAVEKRVEQFKQTLLKEKIPQDQVATLVERAGVYVRVMVTEPVNENTGLRLRMADLEKSLESLEAASEKQRARLEEAEAALRTLKQDKSVLALWVGFGALGLIEVVQLLFLLLRSSASR